MNLLFLLSPHGCSTRMPSLVNFGLQCTPAGCRVTLPRRVLMTLSVITMRSIYRKLCVRLFTLCKISTAIFESCGAIYRQICEMFTALLSASGPVIDAKTASKSMHNWRRYHSSNWYEIDQKRGSKFGALLRRHLTPQRKTAI